MRCAYPLIFDSMYYIYLLISIYGGGVVLKEALGLIITTEKVLTRAEVRVLLPQMS